MESNRQQRDEELNVVSNQVRRLRDARRTDAS